MSARIRRLACALRGHDYTFSRPPTDIGKRVDATCARCGERTTYAFDMQRGFWRVTS